MNNKMLITRKISIGFLSALFTLFLFAYAQKASAVTLKDETIITGTMITLGDIFEGLPRGTDKVLGPAPRPGQEMVLNARTLLRVALALDLPWKPQSSAERITLRRAATVIESTTIKSALKDQLATQGVKGDYDLIIPADKQQIILPFGEENRVEVQKFHFKRDTNYFEATLVAPSQENPLKRIKVSGYVQKLIEIPVLKETIGRGSIIGRHDVEIIKIPENRLNGDMIIKAKNLIGTTPRRILSAGNPVQNNEVEAPKIIERGEFITMIFNNGSLKLTARGKALEHGAKGEMIRVINTGSNKTIEGLVTASREVTIQTF